MSDIVTLTMNPAIDTYLAGDTLRTSKIRCKTTGAGPGGGGVNVALVIRKLGGRAEAALTVGGPGGRRLLGMLDERDVPHHDIWVEGETRDTYVIFERESKRRYHIIIEGPSLGEAEWGAALDLVGELSRPGRYLVLSGSLPPGVPDDFYARAAAIAKEGGCLVAVDTSGPPLAAALAEGVWLAKPNRNELETLAGHEIPTFEERREVAERLVAEGRAEVIAATFGAEGSLIVTAAACWHASPPPIQPMSEVGAGDSFLGALILAITQGRDLPEAVAYAVAAAGSALSKSGPGLSDKDQTERLYAEIKARAGVRQLMP
jgi:6-phosphofructokinase 2